MTRDHDPCSSDVPAWPNLFLVGVPKAGTTYLNEVLAQHPLIYCSHIKAPNFMNADIRMADLPSGDEVLATRVLHAAEIRDEATYLSIYAAGKDFPIRADCSVDYMRSAVAAGKIAEKVPDARIVAVLRNPIERCLSHYLMDSRIGRPVGTFDEEIERHLATLGKDDFWGGNYIDTGFYDEQLVRYFERFPASNILIGLHEELKGDAASFVSRIFRHIGVDRIPLPPVKPQNVSALPRTQRLNRWLYSTGLKQRISRTVPPAIKEAVKKHYYRDLERESYRMTEAQYARLAEVFRDHIVESGRMLDRDLTPWLTGGKVRPLAD